MKKIKYTIFLVSSIVLSACSSNNVNKDIYYWGNYSDVIYHYYNEPGDFGKQEESLNQIIAEASKHQKMVAPGVYGHLALVLLKQGKQSEAQTAMKKEQELHPESTTLMQYLQRKK
ncbi:DUF4810 domain-containing protein [Glaesserella parasuis]|uniref:Putative lipoprotein, periplasmic protein n=1 Tax=Glaesserella parasuis serovar 5 (strain SH0165) TaxID=557723 RepID=B8F6X8_GLAP5|nr:DUF4810 domain-containing protein [Glaesserella parasuis]ACL33080.1 putative lipoprotein, periplasmic protein [Glaesserella parasuis SH0165]MDG6867604.1 DUF4810 domain-containing protein [Glaesserella parasuis]MDO9648401.1 DUF4810 domain-containing protein [Glaesserella parasuis]MDO9962207.1 DUF4810 domain-containing protein [Glaesserella parasuis]MDO9964468.1 DUF4810 domain-containing protein [Glaesserella parasuis]